jgi:hypothetical protein
MRPCGVGIEILLHGSRFALLLKRQVSLVGISGRSGGSSWNTEGLGYNVS